MNALHIDSLQETPPETVLPDGSTLWTEDKECRKALLDRVSKHIVDEFVSCYYLRKCKATSDKVFLYNMHLLSIGLFYVEYCDAIKEGDGNRVLRCWKYLLPIFKSSGCKNYSIEALNLLCQHHHGNPPPDKRHNLFGVVSLMYTDHQAGTFLEISIRSTSIA